MRGAHPPFDPIELALARWSLLPTRELLKVSLSLERLRGSRRRSCICKSPPSSSQGSDSATSRVADPSPPLLVVPRSREDDEALLLLERAPAAALDARRVPRDRRSDDRAPKMIPLSANRRRWLSTLKSAEVVLGMPRRRSCSPPPSAVVPSPGSDSLRCTARRDVWEVLLAGSENTAVQLGDGPERRTVLLPRWLLELVAIFQPPVTTQDLATC